MINEKIHQAIGILQEKNVDMWLTFVRETTSTPDPLLDLILGAKVVWPSAFILTRDGHMDAIVGSLDVQNIRDHADYNVIGYVDSIQNELMKLIRQYDPQTIAINFSKNDVMSDGLTHGMHMILMDYLQDSSYADRILSSEALVAALRGRKSVTEIRYIRGAIAETLAILEAVTDFMKVGFTERDVAQFIIEKMRERDLEPAWDPDHCPAVFTGPESAGAHAGPTERKIAFGHVLNIDFGVRKSGYVSDLQRTWYFLSPDEMSARKEVQRGFDTILSAIRQAAEFLKPGVQGWEVDQVARKVIADSGYEEFPHGLGHQVGRQAHDGSALLCPKWERYKNLPYYRVETGQVYTLEPRLKIKDRGVITMEEIVVVTESGCEFLSRPQEELYCIR